MIRAFNFFIFLILLKHEYDTKSLVRGRYLYESSLQQVSKILCEDLGNVLSQRVVLVVSPQTDTFLYDVVKGSKGNLVLIEKGPSGLRRKPFSLDKGLLYFFVDKKARKFSYHCKKEELDCIFYDKSLNYSNSPVPINLFIEMYKNSRNESRDIKYKEIELQVKSNYRYKELIFKYRHIGTIHETIYKKEDSLYDDIRRHFITFYNEIKERDLFINISEKYIHSILSLMVVRGIIKEDVLDKPGIIEDLFPFVFYKGLDEYYEENNIITGGICFDIIKNNPDLMKYLNLTKLEPFGSRFIVSGVIRRNQGSLYVEII